MAFSLTERTRAALRNINIQPQLVLEIEDVPTIFGVSHIVKVIKIGDPGLLIGDDWVIGGFSEVEDQSDYITLDGTSNEISQQLNPDKGAVSSISSMQVALVDFNDEITELIAPGLVVDDIMSKKAKLWLGFNDTTSFPEDFIPVFKGIIDDILSDQGKITLNIAHPDKKKQSKIFQQMKTTLTGSHDNSTTTIIVADTTDFLAPVNGPSGSPDSGAYYYVQIEDEIIRYTGKTGTTFTGCTRGSLGTSAASHGDGIDVQSFYRIGGVGPILALKLMLSGWNGPFIEDVEITNFVRTDVATLVDNSIFFENVDIEEVYGVTEGDYVTTSGASNGANNVTLKQITDIVKTDAGTYIVIDGVTFVEEAATSGVIDFRSQYDTLADGMQMSPDEVDVVEHLRWYRQFLSSFNYDFYLKETVDGRDFLDREIYLPMAAYSLPRKARSSMGYHIGPLPTSTVVTLDNTNVVNASKLRKRRTTGKNFYNTIVYEYDESPSEDKFLSGHIEDSEDSKNRIKTGGTKALVIKSKGMRASLQGESLANVAATRLLNRYEFAAEFFESVEVKFSVGFNIEAGDIVLLDGTNLNISDSVTGTRGATARLYEVVNKKMNIKNGAIILSLVDTSFSTSNRYGLISPASYIKAGISQKTFIIKSSFSSQFGANEYRKWDRYIGAGIQVRNASGSILGIALLESVSGNQITLDSNLGFVPAADYLMEFAHYNYQTDQVKFIYTFMTDETAFDDGRAQYKMI